MEPTLTSTLIQNQHFAHHFPSSFWIENLPANDVQNDEIFLYNLFPKTMSKKINLNNPFCTFLPCAPRAVHSSAESQTNSICRRRIPRPRHELLPASGAD